MNKNFDRNKKKNPLVNDIKRRYDEDIEISDDLNPDNLAIGELPLIGGLKTKQYTQIGEDELIHEYSKETKK